MALSKQMTRIVSIGTLKEYTVDKEKPSIPGKGVLIADGGNQVRFTIFNKTNGDNQHTKAFDFAEQYKEGDKIFITGQDGRQYSEAKDTWYENVSVWDHRPAEDSEQNRSVFVYVGDVKELTDDKLILSFTNYKDEEIIYPIDIVEKTNKAAGIEVGSRVKIKGMIFSGLEMDYFGDGDYVTKRTAAEITILHTADEIKEEEGDSQKADESGLWS